MSLSKRMDLLKISSPATCSCLSLLLVCFYTKLKTRQTTNSLVFHIIASVDYEKFRSSSGVFLQGRESLVYWPIVALLRWRLKCSKRSTLFSITNTFWRETKLILELFGIWQVAKKKWGTTSAVIFNPRETPWSLLMSLIGSCLNNLKLSQSSLTESFAYASLQLRATVTSKGWKQRSSKLLTSSNTTILLVKFLRVLSSVSNLTR